MINNININPVVRLLHTNKQPTAVETNLRLFLIHRMPEKVVYLYG